MAAISAEGTEPAEPGSSGLAGLATGRGAGAAGPGITRRAVVLGALLIPFNAFFVIRLERVLFGPYPSTISVFANVVFALFVMAGLNRVLRRLAPLRAFGPGEMLIIYTMLAISTGLAGLDGVPTLNQLAAEGAWFGQARGWTSFLPAFPSWLVVSNQAVLHGHFLGHSTFYRAAVLRAWAMPVICWTMFVTLLLFVANCVNVLVRRQWADQEKLSFPIIRLPLAMVEDGDGRTFFRSPLMWGGFVVAAGLSLWNGIAFLFPSLPAIPIQTIDLGQYMVTRPWIAVGWLPVTFYPIAIGLGFLLPLDLLFSCWFFFLYWKAQLVLTSAFGWDVTPDFPFIKEQGFGAIMGLFCFYLWTGRRTYGAVWRSAWSGRGAAPDEASRGEPEALSDRAALIGVALGLAGLMAFCLLAHVTWWVAACFFALYIPTIIVVTRIRAELGPPVHDFHFMGPDNMLPRMVGSTALSQHDMAFFTMSYAFTRAHRGDVAPVGLEGLQMARMKSLDASRMFGAIMLAVVLGTLSAFWAFEHQAYELGALAHFNQGTGMAGEAFARMQSWVGGALDPHPNSMAVSAMVAGLVVTWVLFALRIRFFGFPLHPIGYAISSSWAIHLLWVPLFIAWVLKGLAMRYGGLRAFRYWLPFFLGLVLGDCVMGTIWGLISLGFGIRTYNFFGG